MLKALVATILTVPMIAGCAVAGPTVTTSAATGQSTCRQSLTPALVISGSGIPPVLTVVPPVATYAPNGLSERRNYGLYPGSTIYAEIGGKRWSGEEFIVITPALRAALLSGGTLNIAWSPWPWGGQQETAVSLAGYRGGCL